MWVVEGTWPVGVRDDDPSLSDVLDVLDRFDEFYPLAVESLSRTGLPEENTDG